MKAIRKGLQAAWANKGMVLLLWLANLVLALAVALPAFGWLTRMNSLVEAESMLNGFSLPLLVDLLHYDFATVLRFIGTLVFWLAVCAALVGSFLSGGVLSILAATAPASFLEQFLAGAGRHFLRFLGLLLGGGLFGGVIFIGLNGLLGSAVIHLSEDASELTPILLGLGQMLIALLVGTFFLLALHYARIEIVVEGTRNIARAYWHSLVFVFRNILSTFAVIAFFTALAGVIYLLYFGLSRVLPVKTWMFIFLLMAAQQIVVLVRSAFQVGLYGAELELFLVRRPKLPEPVEFVPLEPVPASEPEA